MKLKCVCRSAIYFTHRVAPIFTVNFTQTHRPNRQSIGSQPRSATSHQSNTFLYSPSLCAALYIWTRYAIDGNTDISLSYANSTTDIAARNNKFSGDIMNLCTARLGSADGPPALPDVLQSVGRSTNCASGGGRFGGFVSKYLEWK